MRESDFAFANQVRAAAELRTPRYVPYALLAAMILLIVTGTTWAITFAILDEVKRGQGRTSSLHARCKSSSRSRGGLIE